MSRIATQCSCQLQVIVVLIVIIGFGVGMLYSVFNNVHDMSTFKKMCVDKGGYIESWDSNYAACYKGQNVQLIAKFKK